ncbi:MAG TPA: TIGR03084 family metal-binding protein [Streptosporangiaceae bacterium]|nr:TIGR03084 family metal-binding protein [Streptosporangiaceae bacterium]
MPADMTALAADLAAESAVTRALVAGLDEAGWRTPTPAAGWDIADQISHLAYFDEVTVQSALRPEQFKAELAEAEASGGINPDAVAARFRDLSGSELLGWFDTARAELLNTFKNLDPRARLPWFGPPMSAASSLTARIMETWAHTQDIADALGVTREPTDRLRHVAHIGVGARAFSYAVHGKTLPQTPVRVELTGPEGAAWTWGPDEADNRISGPALDFCLLVTQRRHRNDLALSIEGPAAIEWMAIAQAFAGTPGTGRPPQRSADD